MMKLFLRFGYRTTTTVMSACVLFLLVMFERGGPGCGVAQAQTSSLVSTNTVQHGRRGIRGLEPVEDTNTEESLVLPLSTESSTTLSSSTSKSKKGSNKKCCQSSNKKNLHIELSYSIVDLLSNNVANVVDFDIFFGVIGNAVRIAGTQTTAPIVSFSWSDDGDQLKPSSPKIPPSTVTTTYEESYKYVGSFDFIEEQTVIVPQNNEENQLPMFLVNGVYHTIELFEHHQHQQYDGSESNYVSTYHGTLTYTGWTKGIEGEFVITGGTQDFVGVEGTIRTIVTIDTMMSFNSVVIVKLDLWL